MMSCVESQDDIFVHIDGVISTSDKAITHEPGFADHEVQIELERRQDDVIIDLHVRVTAERVDAEL